MNAAAQAKGEIQKTGAPAQSRLAIAGSQPWYVLSGRTKSSPADRYNKPSGPYLSEDKLPLARGAMAPASIRPAPLVGRDGGTE